MVKTLPNGHVVSFLPASGTAQPLARPHTTDGVFHNLDYNGGPVMPSNTDYVIYWAPAGYTYPAGYQSGLNQYFTDLAHDSGGHQNTDSTAPQYGDLNGNSANYATTFGGGLNDTQAYPSSGCNSAVYKSGYVCLTDAQLQTELTRFVNANSLTKDLKHEYFIVLPPNVADCFDGSASAGNCSVEGINPAYQAYCAYHSDIQSGSSTLIYSNDPYVGDAYAGAGGAYCQQGASYHPNGSSDSLLDGGLSHEHLESITDPLPNTAWTDYTTGSSFGYENGDKCGYTYGTALGGTGAAGNEYYNQVINGHHYYYQQEWSNQGHQCLQRLASLEDRPLARFASTVDGTNPTTTLDFTALNSPGNSEYHWQWFDTISGFDETETSSPTTTYAYGPTSALQTVSLTLYATDGTSAGATRKVLVGHIAPSPRFAVGNKAPAHGTPDAFDGSYSFTKDAGTTLASYKWNFGDGTSSTAVSPTHTFTAAGTYYVTLITTDSRGQTGMITKEIKAT